MVIAVWISVMGGPVKSCGLCHVRDYDSPVESYDHVMPYDAGHAKSYDVSAMKS